MELTLIRHFATAGNLEKRYIGTTDEPILPVAEIKKMPRAEIVLTSPMIRCRQTAKLLYPEVEQTVWDGFRECDFGSFEGKNYQDLSGDPVYQAWIDSGGTLGFPGGEEPTGFGGAAWKDLIRYWKTAGGWYRDGGSDRPWRHHHEHHGGLCQT
mgnify:CR=1 FL=1